MSARDQIHLRGLRVFGHHGVADAERATGQEFVVDALLYADTAPAAETDDVARTVDWRALAERMAAIVAGESFSLVETLAAHLADECLRNERVHAAQVTVRKPHAPIPVAFEDVSVTIRRERGSLGPTGRRHPSAIPENGPHS